MRLPPHFQACCVNMRWIHDRGTQVWLRPHLSVGSCIFSNRETAQLVKWNLLFIWTAGSLNYFLCCQTTILDFDLFCLEQNREIFWETSDKNQFLFDALLHVFPSGQVKQMLFIGWNTMIKIPFVSSSIQLISIHSMAFWSSQLCMPNYSKHTHGVMICAKGASCSYHSSFSCSFFFLFSWREG